jgi:hypothetical protein
MVKKFSNIVKNSKNSYKSANITNRFFFVIQIAVKFITYLIHLALPERLFLIVGLHR